MFELWLNKIDIFKRGFEKKIVRMNEDSLVNYKREK